MPPASPDAFPAGHLLRATASEHQAGVPYLTFDDLSFSVGQAALDGLVKGKTTFIIAHRLSTVQKCDRIYVVANGTIMEQGSHAKLLDDDKIYAQLFKLQFAK